MHPANIDLQRPRPFSSHAAGDDGHKPAMIMSSNTQQDQMYEDDKAALVQQPLQAQGADTELHAGNAKMKNAQKKKRESGVDYNFLLKQQNEYNDNNNIVNDVPPPPQQQQQFGGNKQGFVYNGGMAGGFNQNYGQNRNYGQNQNYQMPPQQQYEY